MNERERLMVETARGLLNAFKPEMLTKLAPFEQVSRFSTREGKYVLTITLQRSHLIHEITISSDSSSEPDSDLLLSI